MITFVVESSIVAGKADDLRSLISEVGAHCRATETGLLRYDWFIDEDETQIRVVEDYQDSDAIRFHLDNYSAFGPRLNECRTIDRISVLGEPDEALRAALHARGASFFAPAIVSS